MGDVEAAPSPSRFFVLLESPLRKWAGTQNFFSKKRQPYTNRFDEILKQRRGLVVWQKMPSTGMSYREYIVRHMAQNQFLLTTVATGAGKTTQIPSLLLEASAIIWPTTTLAGDTRKVVCTQPKRLNVVTNAQRVAEELDVTLGGVVGYQVGGGTAKQSSATLLQFCTAGILVQKFANPRDFFREYKAILVDEQHERSTETDIVLAYLRYYILEKGMGKDFKVIIMSATIPEMERLRVMDYFKLKQSDYLNIPGTQNDIVANWRQKPVDDLWKFCAQMAIELQYLGAHYCPTVDAQGKVMTSNVIGEQNCGETLIFLPGAREISEVESTIETLLLTPRYIEIAQQKPLIVRRLMGGGDPDSPDIVATRMKPASDFILENGKNAWGKIILATNAAESGITFAGIDSVIDSGLRKEVTYCPMTGQTFFISSHESHNSMMQRRGRVGRKRKGFWFPAFTEKYANSELRPGDSPSIIATNFSGSTMKFIISDILPYQMPLLSNPSPEQVSAAWRSLIYLGFVNDNGVATSAGLLANKLGPTISPEHARMIIQSIKEGCVAEMVTIVAMMQALQTSGGLRISDPNATKKATSWPPQEYKESLLTWSNPNQDHGIEHLVLLEIFEKAMQIPDEDRTEWCRDRLINPKLIEAADEVKRDMFDALVENNVMISWVPTTEKVKQLIGAHNIADNSQHAPSSQTFDMGWAEKIRRCVFYGNVLKIVRKFQLPPKSGLGMVYKSMTHTKLMGGIGAMTEGTGMDGWMIFSQKDPTYRPQKWPPYTFCYESVMTTEFQGTMKNTFKFVCTIPQELEKLSPFSKIE